MQRGQLVPSFQMASTPWLYVLGALQHGLQAVTTSMKTARNTCHGEGLLLLQAQVHRTLHFDPPPNLNRWTLQLGLAVSLACAVLLLACYFTRGREPKAGTALVDKFRPPMELSDCKIFNDYVL